MNAIRPGRPAPGRDNNRRATRERARRRRSGTEAEDVATAGAFLHGGRGHRGHDGATRGDRRDSCAEGERARLARDRRERRERVATGDLREEHAAVAEVLGEARERGERGERERIAERERGAGQPRHGPRPPPPRPGPRDQRNGRSRNAIPRNRGATNAPTSRTRTEIAAKPAGEVQILGLLGTAESVETIGRDDLFAFLARHYTASNMVLSAAGRVDHDQIVDLADKYFGTVPRTPANAESPVPLAYIGGDGREARALEQAHLVLGCQGIGYRDPDYYAMAVF